jgi:hypothetical protein
VRRRLIVTALALERYRIKNSRYPQTLDELSPDFLKTAVLDFADGKPLLYRLTDDGHFVLYSIGLDCADDGGKWSQRNKQEKVNLLSPPFNRHREPDVVWPRPATDAEVSALKQSRLEQQIKQFKKANDEQSDEWWDSTARRQRQAEKILSSPSTNQLSDTMYHRQLLSEFLKNENSGGTNHMTLEALLKPRQIMTGEEPETVTFEFPIAYDRLTNVAQLALGIDCVADEDSDSGCLVLMENCKRAQNGNSLLVWNTIFEPPGKHALQVVLSTKDNAPAYVETAGPPFPFTISNLCQISASSDHFDPNLGAAIHFKFPEPNGKYQIDLISTNGARLKRFEGTTSNGVVKLHWDLIQDDGKRFAGNFFSSIFHLTLPDSGRSQTMKGP